jgi:FADH2 O2-dependent halogenase
LKLQEMPFENLPPTQGLYTHFSGVRRLEDIPVFSSGETSPYPIDDAAVHHVFDGGWVWVLRFNNGITSAGVAATDPLADELRFAEGAPAWERLLHRLPTLAEQFREAKPQFPFVHAPRLSFRSEAIVGERWALLPSAAGFIDPLLSTGFPLTLFGVDRLARAIEGDWDSACFRERLQVYSTQTSCELLAAERLIAALYANMKEFDLFTSLSLLYFAAASFAEAARRLGRPELAGSFLLYDHAGFGPQSRSCLEQAMKPLNPTQKAQLVEKTQQTIEPVNVAGLGVPGRRNWYPVDANDLLSAAGKLGVSEKEIEQLLKRSGFWSE